MITILITLLIIPGSCNSTGVGPHSDTCLMKWWLEAGCLPRGSYSPSKAPDKQMNYWNGIRVASVKADMDNYKRFSRDSSGYLEKCVGDKFLGK